MGWIDCNDRLPPEGLNVLLEVSGPFAAPYGLVADHDFYIGCWIIPHGETERVWLITDGHEGMDYHLYSPTVHAWMPLPRHFAQNERFRPEPDMMEHAMYEDDPPDLYKGNMVYEQMSLDEFLGGAGWTDK